MAVDLPQPTLCVMAARSRVESGPRSLAAACASSHGQQDVRPSLASCLIYRQTVQSMVQEDTVTAMGGSGSTNRAVQAMLVDTDIRLCR